MFTATVMSALAVGALSLNLRLGGEGGWRQQGCWAGFALFLIDFVTLESLASAVYGIVIHSVRMTIVSPLDET